MTFLKPCKRAGGSRDNKITWHVLNIRFPEFSKISMLHFLAFSCKGFLLKGVHISQSVDIPQSGIEKSRRVSSS